MNSKVATILIYVVVYKFLFTYIYRPFLGRFFRCTILWEQGGTLYFLVQQKMNVPLLNRFKWWLLGGNRAGDVTHLCEFINQEAVMLSSNAEMIKGVDSGRGRQGQGQGQGRTLLTSGPPQRKGFQQGQQQGQQRGVQQGPRQWQDRSKGQCCACGGNHTVHNCAKYKASDLDGRWNMAKSGGLCYRCLGGDHRGVDCTKSQPCPVDSCRGLHHRLLHDDRAAQRRGMSQLGGDGQAVERVGNRAAVPATEAAAGDRIARDGGQALTTNVVLYNATRDYLLLRTVTVIVRYGGREMKLNAVLDDGSTTSFLNKDIVAQLAMHEEPSPVKLEY